MPRIELELSPVDHITCDAIGSPGQRVFYIQGKKEQEVVTLILEKFQLQSLSVGIETFLSEIAQRFPDLPAASAEYEASVMKIIPPVEPLFRIANIELGYNFDDDLAILIIQELLPETSEEEPGSVRYWCTRSQLRSFGLWGFNVVSGGRPVCPQCGQPEEPEGHFCSKKNGGHKRD
ncbi:MAG: DUF3090 domain-containing protein [Anaerolineae bacterium]|nr:DUF3090 domain-containing protein [Anaerolineae bacterium]